MVIKKLNHYNCKALKGLNEALELQAKEFEDKIKITVFDSKQLHMPKHIKP